MVDTGFPMPLCGVDEAGRGPLAGPVVAAAVILPERDCPGGINDSKKLTEKTRARLCAEIRACAIVGSEWSNRRRSTGSTSIGQR